MRDKMHHWRGFFSLSFSTISLLLIQFANAQFGALPPGSVNSPLPRSGPTEDNPSTNASSTFKAYPNSSSGSNVEVQATARNATSTLSTSSKDSTLGDAINAGLAGSLSAVESDLISLEYRNAPILEVIRTLADAANLNITLSPDVEKGSPVTIRLTKVTYEQALRAILDTYKFGAVLENGILKVDTIANLTASREEKIKEQEAFWKTQPSKRLVWQVNYAKALKLSDLLRSMLKAYGADPRFSIIADERTNKIIIEGIADALVEAKSILGSLDRRKQQVLIEARIVEASSELSKTLSITWGTRFGFEGNRGMGNTLLFPNSVVGSVGGAGALGGSAPNPMVGRQQTQLGTMQFTVGSINNLVNIDAILRAYETEALANVIASPRVVVQDQERAKIKEDITLSRPVLGPDGKPEGRNTIANLELNVSPQITSDNTLELDIQVQRQTPTNAPSDPVQGSIKREANTKLIVANGETAVIGGLYQTQKFKGQGRIPFLGRLPIIGVLFRTNEEQSFRSELMVLITPRILPDNGGGSQIPTRNEVPMTSPTSGQGQNNFNNSSNMFGENNSSLNANSGLSGAGPANKKVMSLSNKNASSPNNGNNGSENSREPNAIQPFNSASISDETNTSNDLRNGSNFNSNEFSAQNGNNSQKGVNAEENLNASGEERIDTDEKLSNLDGGDL